MGNILHTRLNTLCLLAICPITFTVFVFISDLWDYTLFNSTCSSCYLLMNVLPETYLVFLLKDSVNTWWTEMLCWTCFMLFFLSYIGVLTYIQKDSIWVFVSQQPSVIKILNSRDKEYWTKFYRKECKKHWVYFWFYWDFLCVVLNLLILFFH